MLSLSVPLFEELAKAALQRFRKRAPGIAFTGLFAEQNAQLEILGPFRRITQFSRRSCKESPGFPCVLVAAVQNGAEQI